MNLVQLQSTELDFNGGFSGFEALVRDSIAPSADKALSGLKSGMDTANALAANTSMRFQVENATPQGKVEMAKEAVVNEVAQKQGAQLA